MQEQELQEHEKLWGIMVTEASSTGKELKSRCGGKQLRQQGLQEFPMLGAPSTGRDRKIQWRGQWQQQQEPLEELGPAAAIAKMLSQRWLWEELKKTPAGVKAQVPAQRTHMPRAFDAKGKEG